MSKYESFKEYVLTEVLREVDGVTAKAMFGGWGIYKSGKFFAMIADGQLFFKVDNSNRGDYQKLGSKQFIYVSPKGKEMKMGYYQVPGEIMESGDIYSWVEKSYQVALNSKKK